MIGKKGQGGINLLMKSLAAIAVLFVVIGIIMWAQKALGGVKDTNECRDKTLTFESAKCVANATACLGDDFIMSAENNYGCPSKGNDKEETFCCYKLRTNI